jgi:uncharacterized membrane protein
MTSTPEQLINDYLRQLDRELEDLPRAQRREVVQEISEHIEDVKSAGQVDEVETLNLLERLGDPTEIATEARLRFGVTRPKGGALEIGAIVLLLVGGFLWGIGWLVGVVLLWSSAVWTTREKVIGMLVFPGGLALPLFLFVFYAVSYPNQQCFSGPNGTTACTGGISALTQAAAIVVFVGLIVGNIATAVYLGRRMRRSSAVAVTA